jgi:hypothetical protein
MIFSLKSVYRFLSESGLKRFWDLQDFSGYKVKPVSKPVRFGQVSLQILQILSSF